MNQVAVSFPVSHGAWGTNGLSNKPSIHPSNVLLSILLRMSVSLEPLSNRILVFPGALLGISFYKGSLQMHVCDICLSLGMQQQWEGASSEKMH